MWSRLVVVVALASALNADPPYVDEYSRVDCYPQKTDDLTEEVCLKRGCLWDINATDILQVPKCYFPATTGYYLESHGAQEYILIKEAFPKPDYNPPCPYGSDIELLRLTTRTLGSIFNIRIEPRNPPIKRYEPDIKMLNPTDGDPNMLHIETNEDKLNETFFFKVVRSSTGTAIWDTSIGGLMFADQFTQIATKLPSDKIYGFGENIHQSLKHDFYHYRTWSMFARDEAPDSRIEDTKNLYGVHPFYLGVEKDNKAHGVFILNSNAQEITTGKFPHLIYRTIGGILDIYYLPGPTPADVIKQYLSLVGKPFLPPLWALGFQLSRYGYQNLDDLKGAVDRTVNAGIPLDVVYADIDYMDKCQDFTLGDGWKGLGDYAKELHSKNMKLILIFDPAIDVTSQAFAHAIQQNASFIEYPRKDLTQGLEDQYPLTNGTKIMLSVVWPEHHVAFPDFYDPQSNTKEWWINEFKQFHDLVEYDGVWIDMNEPSAFNTNSVDVGNLETLQCYDFPEMDSKYDDPPFPSSNVYRYGDYASLASNTLCMLASTARGTQRFYNNKNLYGLYESMLTYEAAQNVTGKRGVVISRSTYPSAGRYGGHWLGDNRASWTDLTTSILGIQEFNMFGIPYVGSDICGFYLNASEILCLRWQQLGAFYSFSRNHNVKGALPQDPAQWPSVANATRQANLFRYSFISYLYSLHFAAAKDGETVIRPMFFEVDDYDVYHLVDKQFMWGPSIMVVPIWETVGDGPLVFIPNGSYWYSLRDHDYGVSHTNEHRLMQALPNQLLPVFLRGGHIVPRQKPETTTTETRKNPIQLIIAVDGNYTIVANESMATSGAATGHFYWDDGEKIVTDFEHHSYCEFEIEFTFMYDVGFISLYQVGQSCDGAIVPFLESVDIMGYPYEVNVQSFTVGSVNVSAEDFRCTFNKTLKLLHFEKTNLVNLTALPFTEIHWKNDVPAISTSTSTTTTTTSLPTTATTSGLASSTSAISSTFAPNTSPTTATASSSSATSAVATSRRPPASTASTTLRIATGTSKPATSSSNPSTIACLLPTTQGAFKFYFSILSVLVITALVNYL